jgi:hypothetical protein
MPAPCPSTIAAYRQILPTLWRQRHDPDHHIEPQLPVTARPFRPELHEVA